ncbi:hypothetical protein HYFRA_00001524 [Hymenoscyphus fraxineus]|uniref:Rhodopsin domain-containing protein n=1 Tax=Hymenoscyphus fraxineus TaxID=746836 RepID=A0A9N9L428_9HELO|nr:hypothetical protein HYFRA_00001524 [Hymenoscyphus fraxineus]
MNSALNTEYLAASQSWRLLEVAIILVVIEITFTALYITSKLRMSVVQGPDFYLMICALLVNLCMVAVCFTYVKLGGLGHHIEAVTPQEVVSFTKSKMALIYLYITAVTLPKLAILCLYLRLFKAKGYRYAAYGIAGFLVITLALAWVLASVMCTPFAFNWDETIPGGKCLNKELLYALMSMPNIGTDIAMFILPLPVIWRLKMTRNQKIGLTITFLTGSMGIVTAVIRLVVFQRLSADYDFYWSSTDTVMWTIIEPGIYLIAATLPSLRTLFNPYIKRLRASTLRKRFSLTNQSGPDKLRENAKEAKESHVSTLPQELATHKNVSRPKTVVVSCGTPVRDSIQCFSRLEGPWQPDLVIDRPQSLVTCYKGTSIIDALSNRREDSGAIDGSSEAERNPFVIRVEKTTSLSIEPRVVKGVSEMV